MEAWSALKSPSVWLRWLWTWLNTHYQEPLTTTDDTTARITTDCTNFTLDFKHLIFLQTLQPWFQYEIKISLSSVERTLENRKTGQFLSRLPSSLLLVQLFLPHVSLAGNFPLILFDTAFCKKPAFQESPSLTLLTDDRYLDKCWMVFTMTEVGGIELYCEKYSVYNVLLDTRFLISMDYKP